MIPHYDGLSCVPAHLATANKLAALDLPRKPGEPVATVTIARRLGKDIVSNLYDIAADPPTEDSAPQLEASAAGRAFAACTGCGARPDTGLSQGTGQCEACRHLEALRTAHREAQRRRDQAQVWAAERVADAATLVVWIDEHTPPPAPSGRARKPNAHTLTAVTAQGDGLLWLTYRLLGVGPRVRSVPDGAVAFDDATAAVGALGQRQFVTWTYLNLLHMVQLATGHGTSLAAHGAALDTYASWWRGDIDPHTARIRPAIAPGNADRLALLLRRIAASGEGA